MNRDFHRKNKDRHKRRRAEIQTDTYTTEGKKYKQTDIQKDEKTDIQTDGETDIKSEKQK
jgi:hypothetical protein